MQKDTYKNTGLLKSIRLSKAAIKSHVNKRYRKSLSERIMQKVDEQFKSQNSIDFALYSSMLHNVLFAPTAYKLPSGATWTGPSLFKFCFDVFNYGDKDFVCEHDLFQFVLQVSTESEKIDLDEVKMVN